MGQIWAIKKRELQSYFKSPMGWVLLGIYAFVSGMYFSSMVMNAYVDVSSVLQFMRSLFFILIPILTMRTIAEDKKNGTEVLLATSPATTTQIVLGKYFSVVCMFIILSAINLVYVLVTLSLGGTVDIRYFGTLIAYLLTAFTYIAIGVFASAVTENQIIAAVISFVIFAIFEIMGNISSLLGNLVYSFFNKVDFFNIIPAEFDQAAGTAVTNAVNWLNPSNRLAGFFHGTFDLMALIYFLSIIVIFVYITIQIMEKRRWSK